MRSRIRPALLLLLALQVGCSRREDGPDHDARLRGLIGHHLPVVERLDRAWVCRLRTDPRAQAEPRDPAPLSRFLGFQEVLGRSEPLAEDVVQGLRAGLLDPGTWEHDLGEPPFLVLCAHALVLQAGEGVRALLVDLDSGQARFTAGTGHLTPVTLLLSPAGKDLLRPVLAAPLPATR